MKRVWTARLAATAVLWVSLGMASEGNPAASEGATARAPLTPPNAQVAPARSFGYVIGDVVTQRVRLALNGRGFEPASLPEPGPAGIWLERRAVRVERDPAGARWLAIDYQIMNSPQALTVVTLPAWQLASRGEGGAVLSVPPWPISVAPLTPRQPFARAGLGALRPDRTAMLVSLAPIRHGLAWSSAGLIASLLAWVGWWLWRNARAAAGLPFAIALRELRGMDPAGAQAWQALHRAFDRTAGEVVHAETLPGLFERAPHFVPLRASIERFYLQSTAWFFRGEPPAEPVSVRALCTDLRKLEKQHET